MLVGYLRSVSDCSGLDAHTFGSYLGLSDPRAFAPHKDSRRSVLKDLHRCIANHVSTHHLYPLQKGRGKKILENRCKVFKALEIALSDNFPLS